MREAASPTSFFVDILLTNFIIGVWSCPPVGSDVVGTCVEGCSSDGECKEGEKCCSNGCGHQCTPAIQLAEGEIENTHNFKFPVYVNVLMIMCDNVDGLKNVIRFIYISTGTNLSI